MCIRFVYKAYGFASHGLKHLLQLDSELLDVVDDDAGLRGKGRGKVRG